jgi:acyl dehydratase
VPAASDAARELLEPWVGRALSDLTPAPDEVNLPMIRHWVDALDDRNPVYLDEASAAATRFGGLVAPPAMLQAWTMARPIIAGIAERGGAPREVHAESPISIFDDAGFTGTLATNSELEFVRYLRIGDRLRSSTVVESISDLKTTAIGQGYFLTWVTTFIDETDEVVGRQRFRILKFDPRRTGTDGASSSRRAQASETNDAGEGLPSFELDVTSTVIVAGAIASRDFMPAHHDAEFARSQGAPDMFMNILTSNGYVSRYVTDWAGPEAMLKSIAIRLGAPAIPGRVLRFTGRLSSSTEERDEHVLEVAVRAANDLGDHVTGTVVLTVPASRRG